jgi:hypothetical protein
MMTIRPGDFWVADIPFTDGSASKKSAPYSCYGWTATMLL